MENDNSSLEAPGDAPRKVSELIGRGQNLSPAAASVVRRLDAVSREAESGDALQYREFGRALTRLPESLKKGTTLEYDEELPGGLQGHVNPDNPGECKVTFGSLDSPAGRLVAATATSPDEREALAEGILVHEITHCRDTRAVAEWASTPLDEKPHLVRISEARADLAASTYLRERGNADLAERWLDLRESMGGHDPGHNTSAYVRKAEAAPLERLPGEDIASASIRNIDALDGQREASPARGGPPQGLIGEGPTLSGRALNIEQALWEMPAEAATHPSVALNSQMSLADTREAALKIDKLAAHASPDTLIALVPNHTKIDVKAYAPGDFHKIPASAEVHPASTYQHIAESGLQSGAISNLRLAAPTAFYEARTLDLIDAVGPALIKDIEQRGLDHTEVKSLHGELNQAKEAAGLQGTLGPEQAVYVLGDLKATGQSQGTVDLYQKEGQVAARVAGAGMEPDLADKTPAAKLELVKASEHQVRKEEKAEPAMSAGH